MPATAHVVYKDLLGGDRGSCRRRPSEPTSPRLPKSAGVDVAAFFAPTADGTGPTTSVRAITSQRLAPDRDLRDRVGARTPKANRSAPADEVTALDLMSVGRLERPPTTTAALGRGRTYRVEAVDPTDRRLMATADVVVDLALPGRLTSDAGIDAGGGHWPSSSPHARHGHQPRRPPHQLLWAVGPVRDLQPVSRRRVAHDVPGRRVHGRACDGLYWSVSWTNAARRVAVDGRLSEVGIDLTHSPARRERRAFGANAAPDDVPSGAPSDPNSRFLQFQIDFGDGSLIDRRTLSAPYDPGAIHTYNRVGNYQALVSVST